MTPLWAATALLAAVAALFVLLALRRGAGSVTDRRAANIALYEARLADLEQERQARTLDAEDVETLRTEAGVTLLADTEQPDLPLAPVRRGSPVLAALLAVVVPAVAFVLYAELGAAPDLEIAAALTADRGDGAADGNGAGGEAATDSPHGDVGSAELVRSLQARMQEQPDNLDGWFLLGRTALAAGAYAAASEAFTHLQARTPDTPAVEIYLAQALFLEDGRELTGRVRAQIDKVLALDPNEPIVLQLLALDAFNKGEFRTTIELIERALAGNPDAQMREFFAEGLRRARAELGEDAPPPAAVAAAPAGGGGFDVHVALAPGVDAPAGSAVFVLARPAGGPPMPLAVVRRSPEGLPATVRLDDQAAMNPGQPLSGAREVQLVARLSLSGNALRGEGDVEAVLGPLPVGPGIQPVTMTIGGESRVDGAAVAAAAAGAAPAPSRAPVAGGAGSSAVAPPPAAAIAGAAPGTAPGGAPSAGAIRVLVELDPGVTADPSTVVFVLARERGGMPMPVAAVRLTVADLPALVTLDDSTSPMPTRKLSAVADVEVLARLSVSGQPMRGPGDLEGRPEPAGPLDRSRVQRIVIRR